jgi:uncharacterized protein YbjT (DUF2867 family)
VLINSGHDVICIARDPSKFEGIPWSSRATIVRGDVLDQSTLDNACTGVDTIYYLVHSIGTSGDFSKSDRVGAANTVAAASAAGVKRIVYLGGIIPSEIEQVSKHLASRAEVGQIFLDSAIPAVVLQAGVIIGSGSASFEMLRYLTERLPTMVTPRWVDSKVSPIAVRDVLRYLVAALELPTDTNRRFDIAGPEVMTYRDMMHRYARVAGLRKRLIVPIPVLTPRLSSHWVNIVTPVPRAIARPLVESLRNSVVPREHDLQDIVGLSPIGYDDAVRLALQRIPEGSVETRWSDASWPNAPSDPLPTDPSWAGGDVELDERDRHVNAAPSEVRKVVEGIGGEGGWYSFPLAWAVRGFLDRLFGGAGLRRGRRQPDQLHVGEALDFWRVEALERGHLLLLRAEMRLPGLAWLEFRVEPDGSGSRILQRAIFRPRGIAGKLYWWSVWPFHGIVFEGMLRNMSRTAESEIPPVGHECTARIADQPKTERDWAHVHHRDQHRYQRG